MSGDEIKNIQITETYQKARRSYGVYSSLLIAWELIGITVSDVPLDSVKITIESTEAAPYVLFILVVYFGIRLTIERYHLHESVREERVTKIDFWLSHSIGFIAVNIYSYQAITELQLFNKVDTIYLIYGTYVLLSQAMYYFFSAIIKEMNTEIKDSKARSKHIQNALDDNYGTESENERLKMDLKKHEYIIKGFRNRRNIYLSIVLLMIMIGIAFPLLFSKNLIIQALYLLISVLTINLVIK